MLYPSHLVQLMTFTLLNTAVPLTHLNIMTTMRNIVSTYEFTPKDKGLLVMPLFHGKSRQCVSALSIAKPLEYVQSMDWSLGCWLLC